jgi:hypothetical protein
LSRIDPTNVEVLAEVLLGRDRVVVDDIEDLGLTPGLHKYSVRADSIHRLHMAFSTCLPNVHGTKQALDDGELNVYM